MFQEVCDVIHGEPPRYECRAGKAGGDDIDLVKAGAQVISDNPWLIEDRWGIPYRRLPHETVVATLRINKDAARRLASTRDDQVGVRYWREAYVGFRLYALRQRQERRTEPPFLRLARAM